MAAPRSTSLRALRALSQQSPSATTLYCRRRLHITGAFSAQPANGSDKATLYASRTIEDLKLECERRALTTLGTKSELIERLSNHDLLQSRAFSIAMKRIDGNAFGGSKSRQFNTSRANKAVKDSSTMDFVYMPSMSSLEGPDYSSQFRVPVFSDPYSSSPMKPQIHAVSELASDTSASPMSEVVDNHSMDIDPFRLTETVGRSRDGENQQKLAANQPQKGVIGELWSGIVDDLLGPKGNGSSSLKK
ncbi:hypothetical protein VTN77DRAFT_1174 [Rasamsonia byssochlamydoides]|uniref:uncharacterized protein n=1 Tax=Rasamsonia byssochlamydoides TaxID=89139 RepID=UPI003742698D